MPSDPQAVLARSYNDCDCVPGHKCDCWELKDLFDLQQTRMEAATKLWRERNPGNDLVLPDLGRLLDWMARALAESEERAELGDAWAAAEATGVTELGVSCRNDGPEAGCYAVGLRPVMSMHDTFGPFETPVAALRALAAALSEPETPR